MEFPDVMNMPHITLAYGSVLGLIFIVLCFLVVRGRVKHKVGAGEGTGGELTGVCRAQGNFSEYVPIILVLMLAVEMAGGGELMLRLVGGGLIVGRILHAWGLIASNGGEHWARLVGTLLTWIALIAISIEGLLVVYG